MKFVLASRNAKKCKEIQAKLAEMGIEVVPLPANAPDPVEDGETFEQNALIKARSALEFTGMPAIADDSGLAVDALGGAPGVYSARYCEGTDEDRNRLLLRNMEQIPDGAREARFVCAIACLFPEEEHDPILVRGECSGVILHEKRGEGGFGYDPLFYVPSENATFSELTMEQKARISHRGQALDQCAERLRDILKTNC